MNARVGPPARSAEPRLIDDVVATIALTLFSIAVAIGFARVFTGWDFLDDMIVLCLAGHGSSLLLRRLRVSGWIAVPLTAIVTVWTIGMIQYRSTYSWMLPTGDTWALFESELEIVRQQFSVAVAPVLYGSGWDVLAAIGLTIAIVLSDAFAFRAFARAEALVPGGVLFVFVGALGTDRLRVASTVLLVIAGVVATMVLRWYHAPAPARGQRSSVGFMIPAAVGITLAVALTAGIVGPRLPGADAAPVYETSGRGSGSGTEVSPLVDIKSRLTNRKNTELFVVDANLESYWRSSSLPLFDGRTWRPPDRELEAPDDTLAPSGQGTVALFQQVRVVELTGTLIPAAADPTAATGPSLLRWDVDSTSLVPADGEDLARGDTFQIESASPRFDPDVLSGATATDAGDPIFLELPDDLPDIVASTAADVTAGSPDAYTAARTLQDWFQGFEYSLEVQPGHGNSAIEGFLRERVGYCEQFAGTYAAMMRTLGIPARVAVGFTSGNQVSPDTFSVLGRHAHAWPEVWFDGIGWVPFEPTPSRGAPGAESHTGLPPEQDTGTPADSEPVAADDDGAPPTTTPASETSDDQALNLPEEDLQEPAEPAADEVAETATDDNSWMLGVLALLAVVAVVAPTALRRTRDRRARQSVDRQLARCWTRALDALEVVGVPRSPDHTPMEAAALTAERFPIAARPIGSLAETLTEATYGIHGTDGFDVAGSYGASRVRDCRNWSRQIERAVNDSVPFSTRLRRYFSSGT